SHYLTARNSSSDLRPVLATEEILLQWRCDDARLHCDIHFGRESVSGLYVRADNSQTRGKKRHSARVRWETGFDGCWAGRQYTARFMGASERRRRSRRKWQGSLGAGGSIVE